MDDDLKAGLRDCTAFEFARPEAAMRPGGWAPAGGDELHRIFENTNFAINVFERRDQLLATETQRGFGAFSNHR